MSPIIQFQRAIEDKQGLIRGLKSKSERLGDNITYTRDVDDFFEKNKQLLILSKDSTKEMSCKKVQSIVFEFCPKNLTNFVNCEFDKIGLSKT